MTAMESCASWLPAGRLSWAIVADSKWALGTVILVVSLYGGLGEWTTNAIVPVSTTSNSQHVLGYLLSASFCASTFALPC